MIEVDTRSRRRRISHPCLKRVSRGEEVRIHRRGQPFATASIGRLGPTFVSAD